jgi:hypothetical protein
MEVDFSEADFNMEADSGGGFNMEADFGCGFQYEGGFRGRISIWRRIPGAGLLTDGLMRRLFYYAY